MTEKTSNLNLSAAETLQRFAVGVEYCGHAYHGWQRQAHPHTLQAHCESALSRIANHPVSVVCSGRTDAGVHATGQVIHFDTTATRTEYSWLMGGNTHLPADIRLTWIKLVPDTFHARFSAISRQYQYWIFNNRFHSALAPHTLTYVANPLEADKMHEAALALSGKHDFSSFRASQCQSHTPIRTIHTINVVRQDKLICITIEANAFLHHMVRNIAGALIEVGRGRHPVSWIKALLDAKNRKLCADTASPKGLYFTQVNYPEQYNIPNVAQIMFTSE